MTEHCGLVAVVGTPNAGKSTLVNRLVGQKVAIVSAKAQTTRTRLLGVAIEGEAQVLLVDTPGIHKPSSQLDRRMMQEVHDALEGRDAILFLVDATHRLHEPAERIEGYQPTPAEDKKALSMAEDNFALSLLRNATCPVILVLNKIDLLRREELLPLIQHWSGRYDFAETVLISARRKDGLDVLTSKMVSMLPEGERFFPADQLTDQPMRFLAAELIREKILLFTGEEVPYASAVVIESWRDPAPQRKPRKKAPGSEPEKLPVTKIAAAVFVERTGQKAILIGKGGAMLKQIGTAARKEIEELLGTRVFLELFVKVREDWRSQRGFVEELDWRRQLEALGKQQSEKTG